MLERQESEREEALLHLKAKLERAAGQAERGELLDGDEVFDELREIIEAQCARCGKNYFSEFGSPTDAVSPGNITAQV